MVQILLKFMRYNIALFTYAYFQFFNIQRDYKMTAPNNPARSDTLTQENQILAPTSNLKRPYLRPTLRCYGEIRDVTLGPSPGTGESGNPGVFRP